MTWRHSTNIFTLSSEFGLGEITGNFGGNGKAWMFFSPCLDVRECGPEYTDSPQCQCVGSSLIPVKCL